MRKTRIDSKKSLKIGLVFLCVGVALLVAGAFMFFNDYSAFSWPSVRGRIVSSEIKSERSGSGSDAEWERKIHITYEYEIGDKVHRGYRIHATKLDGPFSSPFEILEKFATGKTVDVFYNPKNPMEATLVQGVGYVTYIIFFFGMVALVASIWALKSFFQNWDRHP